MGAAPSREVATHSLPRAPLYGQRQQIVLIPLLKDFFPSPDCQLFQQLYDARCDPAVRYYHCTQHADKKEGQITDAAGAEAAGSTERKALVDVGCSAPNVFPGTPCSREELYRTYIELGGEALVYETDAEMISAYQADPTSVRPLPCAVAFYYPPVDSPTDPSAAGADVGDGEEAKPEGSKEAIASLGNAEGTSEAIRKNQLRIFGEKNMGDGGVEGCVSVLGCYVKTTGFVGDISCMLTCGADRQPPSKSAKEAAASTDDMNPADGYEMDLYLTKSAGDHNRTHVLLSAIYTYAEQWQRACLRYSAEKDAASAGAVTSENAVAVPASGAGSGSTSVTEDVYDGTRIFAVTTSPFYKQFVRTVTRSELLATLFSEKDREGGATVSQTAAEGVSSSVKPLEWAPPPLAAVRMRGRRTNVPLLCFLREIRAILLGIHAASTTGNANEAAGREGVPDSSGVSLDRNGRIRGAAMRDLVMWLEDILSPPLDDDKAAAIDARTKRDALLIDTLLNIYAPRTVVQVLVEHIMDCLLHNMNPQDILRALDHGSHGPKDKDVSGDAEDAAGEAAHSKGATTTGAKPLSLRLPDEESIVEPWPPCQGTAVDESPKSGNHSSGSTHPETESTAVVDLSSLKDFLPDKHLYWVVGCRDEARRAAWASLANWHADGNPVWVSHDTDEAHCPDVVGPDGADLLRAMRALSADGTAGKEGADVMEPGLAMELMPVVNAPSSPGSSGARVLRVCPLPLEEALLGELSDACKQAREAGATDEHWVRSEVQRVVSEAKRKEDEEAEAKVRRIAAEEGTDADAAAAALISQADVAPRPDEALDIVGDGASCLYRVILASQAARVIAVTPFFLKVARKKPKKKNIAKTKNGVHGTAVNVFYAAPEPPAPALKTPAATASVVAAGKADKAKGAAVTATAKATLVTSERSTEEGTKLKSGPTGSAPPPPTVATPQEPSATTDKEAAGAETTAAPLSKAQKKKAKKKAAAAAAAAATAAEAEETATTTTVTHDAPVIVEVQKGATAPKSGETAADTATVRKTSVMPEEMAPTTVPSPAEATGSGPTRKASPPAPSPIDANLEEYRQPSPSASAPRRSMSLHAAPFIPQGTSSRPSSLSPHAAPVSYGYGGGSGGQPSPFAQPQATPVPYAYGQGAMQPHQPSPYLPQPHHQPMYNYADPYGFSHMAPVAPPPPAHGVPQAYYAPPPPPPPPSSAPSSWMPYGASPMPPPQSVSYSAAPGPSVPYGGSGSAYRAPPMYGAGSNPVDAMGDPEMISLVPPPPRRPPPVPRSVAAAAAAAAAANGGTAGAEGGAGDASSHPHLLPNTGYASGRAGQGPDGVDSSNDNPSATNTPAASTSTAGTAGGPIQRHVSFDIDAVSGRAQAAVPMAALHSPSAPADLPSQVHSQPPPLPQSPPSLHHAREASSQYWERSSTSQLVFHPDEMNSPMTMDSANFPAERPNMEGSITTSNNDANTTTGAGSGSGLHVTVIRRRTHHHHHVRTGSYISDATTNDGASATGGGGGGLPMSRSYTSLGSASHPHASGTHNPHNASVTQPAQLQHQTSSSNLPPMSPTSANGERAMASTSSAHRRQLQQQQQQQAGGGVASSTRSGDTAASGARHQLKSGKYRWDWRTVNIDYVDED